MATRDEIEAAARVLGIPVGSGAAAVRRAYRRAAKRHHPDAGGDQDTFRMVHEAFRVMAAAAPTTDTSPPSTPTTPGAPVRVVNAYEWHGAPTATVGRWVDVAA